MNPLPWDVAITHRLPWLAELHTEIWSCKELKRQLFRKVKVTQADYTALQERLNELHLDRDSPNYDGTSDDVLNAKLEFLRSLPQLDYDDDEDLELSDNVGDSEASNDDDPGFKSLFPFTIRFLDLSTLKLKATVPHRLPLPLLVRQEYKYISELIKKEQKNATSMIVSGQPGIGEFLVS